MNNQLTQDQKELRKVNKKIRRLKTGRGSWAMEKIMVLEGQQDLLEKKICRGDQAKARASIRKENEGKMTDDDWMAYYRDEGEPMAIDDHIIPNTRETRLHRKRVIKNIQTHMIDEEVVRQLQLTRIMDAIDGIQKEQEKKNKTNQITS